MSSRPLSPSLQIYRPQLTSLLSITHRGTGIFLSLGMLVLAYWLVSVAGGEASFTSARECLSSMPAKLLLVAWSFAFYFHLCNGIRHLFWDSGKGFELKTVYASGYAAIICAVILTGATWLIALSQGAAS